MNMVHIFIDCDRDTPLAGIDPKNVIEIETGVTFARLPHGMKSGKSSISISAPLPDGKHVFIQLSMANFEGVAAAFRGAEQRDREQKQNN